ncbi:MAG: LysE family translocator [Candidatus Portiera sp.]|nr:LysE family translocator [Portiera sp.]
MNELHTFLAIALAHLVAVSSPGPDFAIILRQSVRNGFSKTLPTTMGIGSGILVHVFYSVMGLGIIIATNPIAFNTLKLCGVGYLLYVSWMIWKSNSTISSVTSSTKTAGSSFWQAYRLGFLTNALNVKATIFFLSVYILIAGNSPLILQIIYGIYLAVATFAYFTLLAFLLGGKLREFISKHLIIIEKISAMAMAGLALILLFYNPPDF